MRLACIPVRADLLTCEHVCALSRGHVMHAALAKRNMYRLRHPFNLVTADMCRPLCVHAALLQIIRTATGGM